MGHFIEQNVGSSSLNNVKIYADFPSALLVTTLSKE